MSPKLRIYNGDNNHSGTLAMKRTTRWLLVVGSLASLTCLFGNRVSAGEPEIKCSLKTLFGQYMVHGGGTLFPPAFGVSQQSVSEVAAYSIYYGDGTGTDVVTFTVNGQNANVPARQSTTYTLNAECTDPRTVLPNGPHFNIYVAYDGSGLTEISTDPGFAVSTFDTRVGGSR
jgi:hypothetical protein